MTESISSDVGFVAMECGSMEDFEVPNAILEFDRQSVKCLVFILLSTPLMACFQAGLCDDGTTNMMGEPVDSSKKGTFYLNTNSQPPFAIP